MTRDEMERTFPRFARVELSKAGLLAEASPVRFGTVTGHSTGFANCLIVLPDGRAVAGHYDPDHWQPIPMARLRRQAAVTRRSSR
jgi:hypothetical protein